MKKEMTVTAKTTAEAIEKAVAELGAPSADAIEYTVLEEAKKGLFGIGAAPAKIKASYTVKGIYVALEMIKKVVADMGIEATVTYTKTADGDDRINIDGEGNELLLSDILGTEEDVVFRGLEEDVDIQCLRQALARLPEREKEIVTMRYGLEGRRELTQKEVAQHMGISQSYISRLEKRIMLRLRKELIRQTSCA